MSTTVKLRAGKYLVPVSMTLKDETIILRFPYNKDLLEEVKCFDGATWHPETKIWTINNTPRNIFQLRYLSGENPYARYDKPLVEIKDWLRKLYEHQQEMVSFGLTRHYCILACEMGTGKSLAAIEIMERSNCASSECWYVGPKSGVKAVTRELIKWQSRKFPYMYTYEELVKRIANWTEGEAAPKFVIFDESSKIKTPTTQRSQASMHLANAVREEYGEEGFVILLSGSPAPKSPVDWWHQCEITCPGYLKEGNIKKFRYSLCLVKQKKTFSGGSYPELITWLDDEKKCKTCGQYQDHKNHDLTEPNSHSWEESKNEVARLYRRMKNLVLVKFKKDCLDLPEKQYQIIKVDPTVEMLRVAAMITRTSKRAIEALTLLRELSDGFQYDKQAVGTQPCPACKGARTIFAPAAEVDEIGKAPELIEVTCDYCGGEGRVLKFDRTQAEVSSPKDQEFIDLLDEHEDVGRFIVWGGFTATIDRLIELAHKQEWATLRVDGRGYHATLANGNLVDSDSFLDAMDLSNPKYQELLEEYPRLCFVGHPQAGGMALNLTASPVELFYSNTFNGEARIQSEDRFHRAGMDVNRAATIIDLICLPTDQIVLDNLKKKRRLQDISMGELAEAFK